MASLSKSSKLFSQRTGLEPTFTGPYPVKDVSYDGHPVHSLPLTEPLPLPEQLLSEETNSPDSIKTDLWPHGS